MKASLLLETIITSGVSMEAREHGGVIDTQAKLQAIVNGIGIIETGLTQMFSMTEIKELVKQAIENRNLSALIDITKEVASNLPGEFLQYSKSVKAMLEEAGYTTEPLYLARDKDMIKPGHATQHLVTGQVIYRLRQVYVSITNSNLTSDDRLKAVEIFISMLICNPHLQRRVIEMCLTPQVMANHFDPLLPEGRLLRLKHVLVKMASDSMFDFEEEDKTPTVPPLQLVDEVPSEEEKYQAKPLPWLHFSGTDHLVAMKQEHGTLQEQLSVFHGLLTTKEGTPESRYRNAIAYIHRSEHQVALCKLLFSAADMAKLEKLHDNRKLAELVSDAIRRKVSSQSPTSSIYSHLNRNVPKQPASRQFNPGAAMSFPDELNRLLGEIGINVTPLDLSPLKGNHGNALKSIMEQLGFVKGMSTVMVDEPAARLHSCGFLSQNQKPSEPEPEKHQPEPVLISGGDAQLRADIEKLFVSRGAKVKFIDEVPNICVDEVHTYQVRCGNALVALQYTLNNSLCTLTAVPIEGTQAMKPLNWQAPAEHVPEIWDEIRKSLNYQDAYSRIEHFLEEAGYFTY